MTKFKSLSLFYWMTIATTQTTLGGSGEEQDVNDGEQGDADSVLNGERLLDQDVEADAADEDDLESGPRDDSNGHGRVRSREPELKPVFVESEKHRHDQVSGNARHDDAGERQEVGGGVE